MRATRLAPLVLVLVIISILQLTAAQQTVSSSTQASQLLQQSLAALQGNTSISDVTLSGTAHRVAGSDDESGTATVKALATGAMRLDFSLPSGARSEVRAISNGAPAGNWSGPDGVNHSISPHNLLIDWGWFPAFTLLNVSSSSNTVVTYLGEETRSGHSVEHLNAKQQFPNQKGNIATLLQHLSQMDIYIDCKTSLPVALVFNMHPDSDAGLDIPVELDFSDYRSVNGVQIPFRVQKYINHSLTIDLQFQNVTTNTGLSASSFSL
jgi:type II secretory pathway pseudopilin PulG